MTIFIDQYFLFVAKALTVLFVIAFTIRLVVKSKGKKQGDDKSDQSNLRVGDYSELMRSNAAVLAKALAARGMAHQQISVHVNAAACTGFVVTISDDALAGRLSALKLEITAILMTARPEDMVVIRLKSRGGVVEIFGSAATQIGRLHRAGLRVVASIDEIATSGGYLIATMADEIIATRFAGVGSIGLITTQLNFGTVLERLGVKNEVVTAGQHKLSLSALNPSSAAVLQTHEHHLQAGLNIWRELLRQQRPSVQLEEVTTGRTWFGAEALKVGLIDRISSFDEFVMENFDRYRFITLCTVSGASKSKLTNKIVEIAQRLI